MRNSSELKSASDASGVFKGILPKITGTDNVSNYISFMKGGAYINASGDTVSDNDSFGSPDYMEARSDVVKGLIAAISDDDYSSDNLTKTLNGDTELDGKSAMFLLTYMVKNQYPIDKVKGMLDNSPDLELICPISKILRN